MVIRFYIPILWDMYLRDKRYVIMYARGLQKVKSMQFNCITV